MCIQIPPVKKAEPANHPTAEGCLAAVAAEGNPVVAEDSPAAAEGSPVVEDNPAAAEGSTVAAEDNPAVAAEGSPAVEDNPAAAYIVAHIAERQEAW